MHFAMTKDGNNVNPLDYVSKENPRPTASVVYTNSSLSEGLIFVMEGENPALRGYINGKYTYGHSAYIYNYITEDRKHYLMGNDLNYDCNGNYGFGVCFYVENNYCGGNPNKGQLVGRTRP